jgi:hypothetical protein
VEISRRSDPLADPRYQSPLGSGWWKTNAGWLSILKSHRIDRRAKPVVILFIVALFFLFASVADWRGWGFYAIVAVFLIGAVIVSAPWIRLTTKSGFRSSRSGGEPGQRGETHSSPGSTNREWLSHPSSPACFSLGLCLP